MEIPNKKYKVILADPAWEYSFSGTRTDKEDDYPTMKAKDIANLPIKELADTDCVLFIWVIYNRLKEALDVIQAWGFEYKSCAFCWIKTNKQGNGYFWGMGGWTRANSEICLLATKGNPKPISHAVHNIIISRVREHSRKPDEVRQRIIKLCGNVPRIELFAREKHEVWDVWCNQLPDTTQNLLNGTTGETVFPSQESLISVKRESADSQNLPQSDNKKVEEANFS
jgi:N6-adenosine-specific RNA methylase IME4